MLNTWVQSKRDEEGFTLIELLVVVIIIGILAAIAIPVFLNQRENAWRNSLQSSIQSSVTQIEVEFTNGATSYPVAATQAGFAGTPATQTLTPTSTLTFVDNGTAGYCVQGVDTRLGATTALNTYRQVMGSSGLASIEAGVAC